MAPFSWTAPCPLLLRIDRNFFIFQNYDNPPILYCGYPSLVSSPLAHLFFLALTVIYLCRLRSQLPQLCSLHLLASEHSPVLQVKAAERMAFDERYRQVSRQKKYECLLFDIDDTLYPFGSGIAASVRKNIEDYMIEKLGIDENKVPNLCEALYKDYGTTMAGLRAIGYNFDYEEYHSFVHGKLPYESLQPDPVLRNLLLSLPLRKLIFTNADKKHASEVLKRLGLEDCFEGIVCFETLNPPSEPSSEPVEIFDILEHFADPEPGREIPKTPINCKPNLESMRLALKIAGIESPQRTVFFDDSARNIQSGKRIGLDTVLVGTSKRVVGADYSLESIHNIKEALPKLWEEGKEKVEEGMYNGKVAMATSVRA